MRLRLFGLLGGGAAIYMLAACASSTASTPATPTLDATAIAASAIIAQILAPTDPAVQVATAVAATLTASSPTATQSATAVFPPSTPDATLGAVEVVLPTPTDALVRAPESYATVSCRVENAFGSIGSAYTAQLGCSRSAVEYGPITIEAFQGGYLVWVQAEDRIYAIGNDGRWSSHPNSWQAGETSLPCSAAQAYGYPAMGFGKLWCNDSTVNRLLGAPLGPEEPEDNAQRQIFENGQIFRAHGGETFLLLRDGTGWIL